MSESVLNFLEEKNLPEVTKKKHTYLMMDGHDQEDIYVLKDGVVKVSIVLCDGREFNITYLKGLDMISLLKDEINAVLQGLTEREEKVLRLRFGLLDGRTRTLEEVGKEFNVTRERIRQIEAKALRKLKNPNRCKRLRDFVK
mgnify:FL=1